MKTGLYESVVNSYLSRKLDDTPLELVKTKKIDVADSSQYFSQYLYHVLQNALSLIESDIHKNKIEKQIAICNEIIELLDNDHFESEDFKISNEAKRLLAILDTALTTTNSNEPIRPDTPLSLGAILTNSYQDPSFESQLKKEIHSSNQIDILCSFIKWSGIRILRDDLIKFTNEPNNRLRIITTSYMGATDLKAIDYLSDLPNTDIKISYDTRSTRLHAKAFLFHRNTEFSTAYIGSSNLSNPALTVGLEWNVKISQYEQSFQWNKISATFESYWNDEEFERYDSSKKDKLKRALQPEDISRGEYRIPNFDLRPYSFQQEILDTILVERDYLEKNKHLIVAATGTGKTMIAAFDFKRWGEQFIANYHREPKFLFIAHREEILKQSLMTLRFVLRDQNFGDLMLGSFIPNQMNQLFVSIQTYNSKQLDERFDFDYFDYIVIDEFHHAAAHSYQKLLSHVQPKVLLGLTATPERADGLDVKSYFDDHISAEIRLPDAINRKLLCPFQYFGITDVIDYSKLKWQRGNYQTADLNRQYINNDKRAKLIIEKTVETVLDIHRVKGLGFCVSKKHAEYMSNQFNRAGIPSSHLDADSSREHRNTIQNKLVNCDINFIFVVDLYNEGVDIPEIDTILFLRPTESLTVYLQQLGRGLRLCEGKDYLTVLDFVGRANKNYRFDFRFNALIDKSNKPLVEEIEQEFPDLPAGCSIQLERMATEFILENINKSLKLNKSHIVENMKSFETDSGLELSFSNFINFYQIDIDGIYRKSTWSRLCVDAGIRTDFSDPDEVILSKGLRRFSHINDNQMIGILQQFLRSPDYESIDEDEMLKRRLLMMTYSVWGSGYLKGTSISDCIKRLKNNPVMCKELIDLLQFKISTISNVAPELNLPFICPLQLYSQYTRSEILAALGYWTENSNRSSREGVLYIPEIKTDIFFITLYKNEKSYSPTTMYRDYALSDTLFHWQSQSTTSVDSPTGQRYIHHQENGHTVLLFVREFNKKNGLAEPYFFLGPADYVSHDGSKPINIVWKLKYPIPAHLLRKTAQLIMK